MNDHKEFLKEEAEYKPTQDLINIGVGSTRIENALTKAIEQFEKIELKPKQIQEEIRKNLNEVPIKENGEGMKQYIYASYETNEIRQILNIASKILETKKKEQDKKEKDKLKFNIEEAVDSFQTDFVTFAKGFYDKQPFYYDSAKIWWLWSAEKHLWQRVDETDLLNRIYIVAKAKNLRITSANVKSEITTALKMVGRKNKPLESPPNIIQFKDKIYWIDKDKVRDSSPKYFNCNPIPYEVGESEDTPTIDKIFEEWVGKKYVDTLYEIIAYCMIQDYPMNRIFCFVGSGSNGKSCFLNLLRKVIGENNCSSTELDRLIKNFGTSVLYKKMVCLMGETNFGLLEKTSILKRVSGNDTIDFEFKGKDIFIGKSYAKLIIATNTVPPSTDKTDGWMRRWLSIDFPNQFSEKKDILADIPDIEYNNLCKKSIKIVKELLKKRSFTNEGTIEDRRNRYEQLSNPLKTFIQEKCVEDVNGLIPVYDLHNNYTDYCDQRGFRKISKTELTKLMKEDHYYVERRYVTIDDKENQYRCYVGIRYKRELNDYDK